MVLPVSTPDWSSQDGTETEAQGRVRTTETDRSRARPPGCSNKGERTRHQQRTRQRQRQRTRQRQTSLHLQPARCKRLRILTYRIEVSRRSRLGEMARAVPFVISNSKSSPWRIGDALVFASKERTWGDKCPKFEKEQNHLAYETLRNYKMVASRFSPSQRNDKLT